MEKKLTFMQACKDFFGMHPNQTPVQFAKELKELTESDRADIKAGLENNGYEIIQSA